MAISVKDKETDNLARQVASLTGETLTEAIRTALAERLVRERLKRGQPGDRASAIAEIIRRNRTVPLLDDRSPDEILGYGENGLPS